MKKIFFAVSFAFFAFSLFSEEETGTDFTGTLETRWGVATPQTESDSRARYTLGETSFTGKIEAFYGNSSSFSEGKVTYNSIENELTFLLNEAWIDYTASFWGIRVGRQKAAWGKADAIDITNVICPEDMSSFSNLTADDSKLPVDSLRLSLNGDSFTADAWWIPFFTPASLPLKKNNLLRKYVVPLSVDFPVPALGTTLSLPVTIGEFTEPDKALWNGEYGLKLSGYFSLLDVSLYGFYGWDDIPVLDYTMTYTEGDPSVPNGIEINGKYKRMSMIGADAALPIGQTVLRVESAFFLQRYFQKSAESIFKTKLYNAQNTEYTEKHNEISALSGIDWIKETWTVTAQYFCNFVFGNIENLEREDSYTHGATLSVSKTFLGETLELSFSGVMNFNAFDSLISPSIDYSVSDQITLSCGAYIFIPGPNKDGEYGAYKNLSTAFVSAKFCF